MLLLRFIDEILLLNKFKFVRELKYSIPVKSRIFLESTFNDDIE